MAITQNDVRLYASERMTDYADGGGRMSSVVIVDGLDNNVFPDLTEIDRLAGRTSLRKIFGAITSNDDDTYLSAFAFLDDGPDDAATDAVIYRLSAADELTAEREAARTALVSSEPTAVLEGAYAAGTAAEGSTDLTGCTYPGGTGSFDTFMVGQHALVKLPGTPDRFAFRVVMSRSGTTVVLDSALPFAGSAELLRPTLWGDEWARVYGLTALTASASASAVSLSIGGAGAQVVPWPDGGVRPAPSADFPMPATAEPTCGHLPVIRAGDPVLLHSTQSMAPATVSNSQVVNTGRTTLARLRVIGNNGVEHARFTRGVPAPTGVGCTADLDAGTVTFSDVSGMSQPVTVEHRIEELNLASAVAGATLTLNRPLARAFPSGTKVSSLLLLGDLQGRVEAGFAQQAWTGVWDDARIGGEPLADFNDVVNPIVTTNAGAVPQRWTIIFTNTTAFRVIGEFLGEVGVGSTASDCSPLNPATGVPYFTIPAAGWGLGWSAGNVYRFNTQGALAPLWALRCVAPSLPGGDDSVTVEFRGYINT